MSSGQRSAVRDPKPDSIRECDVASQNLSSVKLIFILLFVLVIPVAVIRAASLKISQWEHGKDAPQAGASAQPIQAQTSIPEAQKAPAIPKPPPLKIETINPTSSGTADYSLVLQECHHSGDRILCSGQITNMTDATINLLLSDSSAVDNEGHGFFIATFGGGFVFDGGGPLAGHLMPNVPTRFIVTVNDAHQNVKSLNLWLNAIRANGSRNETFTFEGVPVQ